MLRARPIFGSLLAAAFMVLLNETTVGVALPTIMRAFGEPTTAAQWLISGYLLALGCVFLTGSLLALCAIGLWMFVLARIVQAAGCSVPPGSASQSPFGGSRNSAQRKCPSRNPT